MSESIYRRGSCIFMRTRTSVHIWGTDCAWRAFQISLLSDYVTLLPVHPTLINQSYPNARGSVVERSLATRVAQVQFPPVHQVSAMPCGMRGSRQIILVKRHGPVLLTSWLLDQSINQSIQSSLETDKNMKVLVVCPSSSSEAEGNK